MNTNLVNIVKQIIAGDYGETVLAEPKRVSALLLLSGLAKDEPKPLRIAFCRCTEAGAYTALKDMPNVSERAECKAAIARQVFEEHGLAESLCAEALDILEAALFEDKKEPLRCAFCGKEIQSDWATCPYCGKSRVAEQPQMAEAPRPAPQPPAYTAPPPSAVYTEPVSKKKPIPYKWIAAAAAIAVLVAAVFFGRNETAGSAPATAAPAAAPAAPKPSASIPADFVRVAVGTFLMGSDNGFGDEEPVHSVTVSGFYMGKYQVTQKEWQEVMGNNPSHFKGNNLPVEQVSWYDAVEYCNRRSRKEGLTPAYQGSGDSITCDWSANGYRLPTEAEWEYAAEGGNNRDNQYYEYSGSNNADRVAWYKDNSGGTTHPVGTKSPNSLGIYDMSGNVYEWCWDWYSDYGSGAQTNPRGASSGSYRVGRGGGWSHSAVSVRSAYRSNSAPSNRYAYLGFRLVRP